MHTYIGDFYAHQFGLTDSPDISVFSLDKAYSYTVVLASDGVWDCWKWQEFHDYVNGFLEREKATQETQRVKEEKEREEKERKREGANAEGKESSEGVIHSTDPDNSESTARAHKNNHSSNHKHKHNVGSNRSTSISHPIGQMEVDLRRRKRRISECRDFSFSHKLVEDALTLSIQRAITNFGSRHYDDASMVSFYVPRVRKRRMRVETKE